ncbi:MAG TPA: hypothetical protein VEG25_08725 [Burkholderiales bacterium]|nr:hypothetical protein [Burkholderiales bacterium]
MKYDSHYYDRAADAWMLQLASIEGNECEANSTLSSEPTVLCAQCDYDWGLPEPEEDVEDLRPEIPGWQRYFKEKDAMQ